MDRRHFLRYGLGLAGAGILALGFSEFLIPKLLGSKGTPSSTSTGSTARTGPSPPSTEQRPSIPDYQEFLSWLHSVSGPYSGKSLNISLETEFGPYAAQLIDSDFGDATGISDRYDIKPYALQLQDISLMSSAKSSAYDAYSLDVENLGVFPDLPISPYELAQEYPALTYPGIDFADFNRNCWDRIATYPPDLTGGNGGDSASDVTVLPFDTPTLVLFYRTDIFEKLGLTPPATWDDHLSNCQAIQKSGLTPFGSASMAGINVSIVYEYQAHLASFGGSLWEVDGDTINPTLNTDAALAALEDFVRFEPYSDPGSIYFTWDDVFNSFAHKSTAQALMFNGYADWLNDPQRSLVPGLVSYAKNPAGPEGAFHPFAGSGVGVSRYSNNPEMAWLWAQWATAKGTQEAMILDQYHVYPTRSSVTKAAPVQAALQTDAYAIASLTNEVWQSNTVTTLIGFPLWLKASTILANALNTAWTGAATPSAALASAQTNLEQMGTLSF